MAQERAEESTSEYDDDAPESVYEAWWTVRITDPTLKRRMKVRAAMIDRPMGEIVQALVKNWLDDGAPEESVTRRVESAA